MNTKERLEKAGWKYLTQWESTKELYYRGTLRIIFDPETNRATHYFDVRVKHLTFLDDIMFNFLTETQ